MSYQENVERFQTMLDEGSHCSQCVFGYWAERMGLDDEFARRASSGLGMGVNHGDSCGAVTATVLALGLARGATSGDAKNGGVEDLVKDVEAAFVERNGSLLCRDLLSGGYDAADPNAHAPEGVDPWENCAKYCADAVELAEQYLTAADLANCPAIVSTPASPWEGMPEPTVVAAGSGAVGVAIGAVAAAIITYERRRAKNEHTLQDRS
ncbi:MAG: C_GCAxxG_C_C family protein [Atopobiaceae bacterium]|nr:C_GCAxxG_C_C family protein [Atopobiaceae bacterium]